MKSFECFETVNMAELNSVLKRCFTEYASRFIMSDNLTDNGLNDMECFFRSACIIVTCDTVVDAIYKLQNHVLYCGKSFCYDISVLFFVVMPCNIVLLFHQYFCGFF